MIVISHCGMDAELKLSETAATSKQSTNVMSQQTLKVHLDLSHFGMPEHTFSCPHANLLRIIQNMSCDLS